MSGETINEPPAGAAAGTLQTFARTCVSTCDWLANLRCNAGLLPCIRMQWRQNRGMQTIHAYGCAARELDYMLSDILFAAELSSKRICSFSLREKKRRIEAYLRYILRLCHFRASHWLQHPSVWIVGNGVDHLTLAFPICAKHTGKLTL